nr:hypothetical protein [Tanacetum cinerariifolium]
MEECSKALTDKLDWNNPERDRHPFELTKRLPLKGHLGRLTVAVEYFFNNNLEFLKSSDLEKKYTTSITKTKSARYEIVGIEDMIPTLWSTKKKILSVVNVKFKKLHGYGHLEEIVSYHQKHVEDLQLGVESYQKKINITKPQKTFPGIEFKEFYTPSFDPPGAIYKDLNKQRRVMRADELYKFLDGTRKLVRDELHHRVLNFCLVYNKEINRRKWSAIDKIDRNLWSKLFKSKCEKGGSSRIWKDWLVHGNSRWTTI